MDLLQENIDKYRLALHSNLIILWYTLTEQCNKYFFSYCVTLFNLTRFVLSLQTYLWAGRRIESFDVLPAIQRNPRVQVNFVSFRSFWPRYGKNITVIGMF